MKPTPSLPRLLLFLLATWWMPATVTANPNVERFGLFETSFQAAGRYANPYTEVNAEARWKRPDGSTRSIPLFWDGGTTWKLRLSPDLPGEWSFTVRANDRGLDGKAGSFTCVPSRRRGSIQPMKGFTHHFQYQNGERMWFMGDTAWALCTDNKEEKHNRAAAERYLDTRAAQGFNVVHCMLLSEAGWGNAGGLPFNDMKAQTLNPGYWQEMDHRLAHANQQGLVVGLALAWGDKRKKEPFAWRRFPNLDARKRYARYVAARYSAYDVYFLVSGEWHAGIRTRPASEAEVRKEFIEIGNVLAKADPHGRMIGIHPMTRQGSVREFNKAEWMRFGDYQQNYRNLHARVLQSLKFNKPVVNAEYGYLLRDRNGDGKPDKDNSTSLESMRHASWDIVMAGGYLVTGFGTTYFGGNRDPGPFDLEAKKNDAWEKQIALIKKRFTDLEWWKLTPHDDWLSCKTARGKDTRQLGMIAPPATTYWLLAEPGQTYLAYARGLSAALKLELGANAAGRYRASLFNPRTGGVTPLGETHRLQDSFRWTPPDNKDWVLHLVKATK
jgi:hypothetical protein